MNGGRRSEGPLRVLLVGPCPPPHGGISVHVATARRVLRQAGFPSRAVDSSGHRAAGAAGAVRSLLRLIGSIDAHARRGWLTHVHTNGHSTASFGVALLAGLAACRGPGRVLTLHSGMLPGFVEHASGAARALARFTAARYERIVCVNEPVRAAMAKLGVPGERLAILPAHLVTPVASVALPERVGCWIAGRSHIVSSALFFRPEYGLDLLLEAAVELRKAYPRLGWVVMGGGDEPAIAAARQEIAARDLEQNVLLTGDLPHEICVAVMARSHVYARPALRDGDAISVREALALGVPVVASDAAARPAGTVLHRSGDAGDLAASIGGLLQASEPSERRTPSASPQEERSLEALLSIYRAAVRPGSGEEPTRRRRVASRLSRLREMGAPEIAYRARNAWRVAADRSASGRPFAFAGSFLVYLREVAADRFYLPAGADLRRATAELLWRRFPTSLSAAASDAERLCEHRVEILGWGEVALGRDIDWHRDPVTGEVWPRRYFADYDTVADRDRDAKRVWELNRHQHLPRLGKAYLLSGEERYAREVVTQMLQWIDQNPVRSGMHWHSSLEIAIRALSWLWALFYVLPSEELDEDAARRIGDSLFAQLDHVARYPSIWSSPNTHLLGEAAALYVAGSVFLDLERGRRWLEQGKSLLEREAARQILADGMHAELSPYYHCYAADFYLQALAITREPEHALDEGVTRRVETMFDALRALTAPDGRVPLLGDDDGGRALALGSSTSYHDARDLLAAAAVLFGRADWKAAAGALREEAFWLVGPSGWKAWEELLVPAERPRFSAVQRASLDHAGYHLDGDADGAGARSLLVFDRGGLGKLGGGHGHADALAIVLRAHGEDLLVDPGTAVYNAAPEWRAFFRSTRAHNTLTIDDADQSAPSGTFKWARRAVTRSLGDGRHSEVRWAAAEHDGYVEATGLVHRRRLLSIDGEYWIVLDDVAAATGREAAPRARRELDLRWHFPPRAEVALDAHDGRPRANGTGATVRVGGAVLRLHVESSLAHTSRLVCGATDPPQGWVSRRYGEMEPAPVLETRMMSGPPALFVTVVEPLTESLSRRSHAGVSAQPVRVLDCGSGRARAIALAIAGPRGEDLVVLASPCASFEAGPCRARAEVVWMRLENDRPVRLLALDAVHVEVAERRHLQLDRPTSQFFWSARESAATPILLEERKHVRYRRDR